MQDFAKYKNTRLAWVSAEKEFVESPELLEEGFFDKNGMISQIMDKSTMLIVGAKGAGKSTIAKYLELQAQSKHDLFVSTVNLEDFPYTPFAKIVPGTEEPNEKLPIAWQWIFCLLMLDAMSKDQSLTAYEPHEFEKMMKELRAEGYLDSSNLSNIISKTKKKGFKISFMDIVSASYNEETGGIGGNISKYTRSLQKTLKSLKSSSRFLVFIDGLDTVLASKNPNFDAIGALISQAARFNDEIRIAGLNAKIVVLCRNDVLARASGPDLNKFSQHDAIELDWYSEFTAPEDTDLFQLVEYRANFQEVGDGNYFASNFAKTLDNHQYFRSLIEQTRYLPRDMFMLLERIRELSTFTPIDTRQFLAGASRYSEKYFYDEILNNIAGHTGKRDAISLFECIADLGKSAFELGELKQIYAARNEKFELIETCKTLFGSGALQSVRLAGSQSIYSAKYRNSRSSFNQSQIILVHKALRKPLVLPLRDPLDEF